MSIHPKYGSGLTAEVRVRTQGCSCVFLLEQRAMCRILSFMWFHQWSIFRDSVHYGISWVVPILWVLKSSLLDAEFGSKCQISYIHPCNKHNIFGNAYEHFNFPLVGEKIYRSGTDTDEPLMGSDRTWKGRCFDWWSQGHCLDCEGMRNRHVNNMGKWNECVSLRIIVVVVVVVLVFCFVFVCVLPSYFIFVRSL